MSAAELLQQGDLDGALSALQDEVRKEPAKAKHRVFLFQLLTVLGQWDRALTQLNVVGDLDGEAMLMVQAYGTTLQTEALRRDVWAGKTTPLVFGDPEAGKTWAGLLGMLLVALAYASIGLFASSVTSNQIIAFFLALLLIVLFLLLSLIGDLGAASGFFGMGEGMAGVLRWLATAEHFSRLTQGLVETRDLVYFAFIVGVFLLLTKASVESVRWR